MRASPFEPEVPARRAEGQAGQRSEQEDRADVNASPKTDDEDQRRDETIDEPGYGHGV
jgi:hypothetical protein